MGRAFLLESSEACTKSLQYFMTDRTTVLRTAMMFYSEVEARPNSFTLGQSKLLADQTLERRFPPVQR